MQINDGANPHLDIVGGVLARLNAYRKKPLERVDGESLLVAKDPKTNRGFFVFDGTFGRQQFKAAVQQAQAHQIDTSRMYIYARLATYSGTSIDFMKFEDLGLIPAYHGGTNCLT